MPRLSKKVVKTLQKAEEILQKNIESIEVTELPGVANDVIQASTDAETVLKTIDDRPVDTAWVPQATRELAGIGKAMTRTRDELANNLGKLSDVDSRTAQVEKHLAREQQKLTETDDPEIQQEIQGRALRHRTRDNQGSKPPLRTEKISDPRIREMITRMLYERTLAERIRTLFRE